MKIRIIIILMAIIIIPGIIYSVMLCDTNSLMQRARNNFAGDIEADESDMLTSSYNFNKMKYPPIALNEKVERVDFKVYRVFTWHNFKDGYIKIRYSVEYFNKNNKEIGGSIGIDSKWKIHKENGEWKVVDIIEAP